MSLSSRAANSVVQAIEQVCGLYDVPFFRMQSRTFTVKGVGGRERPMFMGEWTDELGQKHRKGISDLLTMPTIKGYGVKERVAPVGDLGEEIEYLFRPVGITVPLWIECKFGTSSMGPDQRAFKRYVELAGAHHICAHDSADQVIEWFERNKVKRR